MTTTSKQTRYAVSYRLKIARPWTSIFLLCRLLPTALYHFLARPARRDIPEIGYSFLRGLSLKERAIFAFHDAMHDLLFASYTEITGFKVSPATAPMLNLLIDLTNCFDEYLDHNLSSGAVLPLDEVLEAAQIRERRYAFRRYLQLFGRAEPIIAYLREALTSHYERYVQNLKSASSTLQFEDTLAAAQFDSGAWRRYVIEVIALFNGHEVRSEALQGFYLFGMIHKFADDMFDLRRDIRTGKPNLVYALISQELAELATLQQAMGKRTRLGAAWWETHCPITYGRYFDHVEHYYSQIASKKLRFVSDLFVAPALVGIDLEHLHRQE